MIFEGQVDESEVGRIKEDLPLEITVGAMEGKVFHAILDYIAPKGKHENGGQKFERKDIELGISDSIFVEIKSGISEEDKIKVWNAIE